MVLRGYRGLRTFRARRFSLGKARQGRENQKILQALKNLYVHFPFCRAKCAYCALHSRAGSSEEARRAYVSALVAAIGTLEVSDGGLSSVYFGGGSPALCDLKGVLDALGPHLGAETEFTVELHPLDVSGSLLSMLGDGGVNRISMGVQSLDDAVLADMGRGYGFYEAERAFAEVKRRFSNAGIDLIVGYPGETSALTPRHARLAKWDLAHCSVYSLMLEEKTRLLKDVENGAKTVPDDDTVMNRLQVVEAFLGDIGLERYEISNYARPGFECRHNLAVWRGEDYCGLGEGACGRMGLQRTRNWMFPGASVEELSSERDAKERALFSLRTREGLDCARFPQWAGTLGRFAAEGLLVKDGSVFRLTGRGREVCDSILAELA